MAINAYNCIVDALSILDAVQLGEAPEAGVGMLAVRTLNRLLGEWSTKPYINPLQAYYVQAPANSDHLIVGTDTTTETPDILTYFAEITSVSARMGSVVYKMRSVTLADYQETSVKQTTAPPRIWAWDRQSPNSNIWLWPRALSGISLCVVGTPKLPTISNPQDTLDLDSTWEEAITANLAARLYPFFRRDNGMDKELEVQANKSLDGLKRRARKMLNRPASSAYGASGVSDDYWNSPLNTVTQ